MKIVFIAYDGILTQSVFESQIIKPLELLNKNRGVECHLIAYENIFSCFKSYSALRRKKESIEKNTGIKCHFLPKIPGFKGLGLSAVLLPFIVRARKILTMDSPAVIHSRGAKGASIGIRLRRYFPAAKLIFDARDSEPEQYISDYLKAGPCDLSELPKKMRLLYDKLSCYEKSASIESDHIFTQSYELKKTLKRKYGVPDDKFSIYHNSVSIALFRLLVEERNAIRKELGIENRFVLIYSGTVHPYQIPEKGIEFFKKLLVNAPDSFLLALTFSPEKVTELLLKAGVSEKDYRVMKLHHADVPKYLNAGDAGLLFRVQNEYSKSSAPVKFPEYLSAGLHVVTLAGIGDAPTFINTHGVGIVLENTDVMTLEQGAAKLAMQRGLIMSPASKTRVASLVEHYFSLEPQIKEKYECYQRLLAN